MPQQELNLVIYRTATSKNAKDFLINHLIPTFPFNIKSIQVDGGSENKPRISDNQACLNWTTYGRSLPKDFKTPYKYYEDIIKKERIFSQKVVD